MRIEAVEALYFVLSRHLMKQLLKCKNQGSCETYNVYKHLGAETAQYALKISFKLKVSE